jgi:hypothetical protein
MSTIEHCTTELAIFSLKENVDVYAEGSDGQNVIQKMFAILAEQPGYITGRYGIHKEQTDKITFALGASDHSKELKKITLLIQ